jgi:hypothetical protein
MTRDAIAFLLLSTALLLVATTAAALTTQHLTSDTDMLAVLSDTLFVGEGRIGDGAGAATFEVDLGGDTGAPAQTAQYDWPNGAAVPWTLTYNHLTNEISFTVDAVNLQYTTPLSGFTEIFVRCRAVNAGSDIVVENLVLDGDAVGDNSFADGNATGLDILWIQGGTLTDGFTLTGTATMSWTGTPPTQSRLAFQVKVGTQEVVSTEETTWGRIKSLYETD